MLKYFIIAACAVSMLGGAEAKDALSLKGLVPGVTSKADIEAGAVEGVRIKNCPASLRPSQYAQMCQMGLGTIGGISPKIVTASYYEGVLYNIVALFTTDEAEALASLMQQKYGAGFVSDYKMQNAFGATFAGKAYLWGREGNSLLIKTIGSEVGEGILIFLNEDLSATVGRLESTDKSALDDL